MNIVHGPLAQQLDQNHINPGVILFNAPAKQLRQLAIEKGEVEVTADGILNVDTTPYTGRSVPDDDGTIGRITVFNELTAQHLDTSRHATCSIGEFRNYKEAATRRLAETGGYAVDLFVGRGPYQKKVRVYTQRAVSNMIAQHLFVRPDGKPIQHAEPDFVIWQVPDSQKKAVVALNMFDQKGEAVIAGTLYGGEMKKIAFSWMNFILPLFWDALGMHCAAAVTPRGDTVLIFGLSGTGKTSLSALMPFLIGDDEHILGKLGVYNMEGGCYAKCIDLDPTKEALIYSIATNAAREEHPLAVAENLSYLNGSGKHVDFRSRRVLNTRVAYPMDLIPNVIKSGSGPLPRHIIFLTYDAHGVFPAVSKLSAEQAYYYFLQGYTAKVAGTEKGIGSEPKVDFSTCFGGPFMMLHPKTLAEGLLTSVIANGIQCYLVNTGNVGGGPGVGRRIDIGYTSAIVGAIQNDALMDGAMFYDRQWGVSLPRDNVIPGVPNEVLDPRKGWESQEDYTGTASIVSGLLRENIKKYDVPPGILAAGPKFD